MTMPPNQPVVGPTSNYGSSRKAWFLLAGCLALVVALVIGLLVWRGISSTNAGVEGAPRGGERSDGVGLLREQDPVCEDWLTSADNLAADTEQWAAIDEAVPETNWTPEQRVVYNNAAGKFAAAADHFESMLSQAKNPVLQELIAQTVVYWRAYVAALPRYTERDGKLAGVASNFGGAVTYMCTAVPIVQAMITGSDNLGHEAVKKDPAELIPFITTHDASCADFVALIDRQNAVLRGWESTDPSQPASSWSAEQRRLNLAAAGVMKEDAEQTLAIADNALNATMVDLLRAYAAYAKAYSESVPEYSPDLNQLWKVATYLAGGVGAACGAEL